MSWYFRFTRRRQQQQHMTGEGTKAIGDKTAPSCMSTESHLQSLNRGPLSPFLCRDAISRRDRSGRQGQASAA
ncbi:uncharacterized protein ColSpa_00730 [Colletotrichum spaethianum]|uniref:Uncharacterized protein n=1 Tax=Colletotrichum spaethianum TaxID=700344 RepID=A0AA37P6U5_9PEZI|nr:uncharacterized protein ColSpa_00730 [Colletotrichum spaethianum]GKT40549.1 hypothetical protein ColSpa_00730 [Colletotrichum spaethianum]